MKTEAVDEPSSVEKEDKENNTFLRFLSGAVFDLYEDANSNKEFDSEDTKIGTLKESDAGYHTAEGLLAKGYFVKESKAPEGYQLDENAYYFEITEDGQVAVVENGEAGRGFTNEAYRGNLKITKDSSDGRRADGLCADGIPCGFDQIQPDAEVFERSCGGRGCADRYVGLSGDDGCCVDFPPVPEQWLVCAGVCGRGEDLSERGLSSAAA